MQISYGDEGLFYVKLSTLLVSKKHTVRNQVLFD